MLGLELVRDAERNGDAKSKEVDKYTYTLKQ